MQELNYLPGDRYFHNHPIQTAEAEVFVQVSELPKSYLEGICFDRSGRYAYFCAIYKSSVMKLDMETKEITEIYHNDRLCPVAVKIHRDGRLFICSCNWASAYSPTTMKTNIAGGIFSINPDGTGFSPVITGWCVDDLVFDSKGGMYFTNYIGTLDDPAGGVYYVEPDMTTVRPIVRKLRSPNGLALSKNEKILWITETLTGNILRVDLTHAGHCSIVYHLDGGNGCDSCSIDDDDNLYVAHLYAGRVVVLNQVGVPIAQILIPGREEGHCLHSSHPMVAPGKKELYITAADELEGGGACIYKAPSFAVGNTNSYQFK